MPAGSEKKPQQLDPADIDVGEELNDELTF
jgi:hypothetical protein